MIAPNSSLQDWHAFALDKEPWFDSSLVYIKSCYVHNNSLSDEKHNIIIHNSKN